jgi:hypothetical protein
MAWIWIILALLYVLSRIDLIPDFIFGWGWIDDIVILGMLFRYLARLRTGQTGQSGQSRERFEQQHGSPSAFEGPKSPYEILDVPPHADAAQIRAAYRKLASQYHPDKVSHLGKEFQEIAEKRFKEIQHAYQELTGSKNQQV